MKKDNATILTGYVALLSAIFCGITWYLLPHIPLVWQISGGVAVVSFIAYLFLDRKAYQESLAKKSTQYGLNSLLMSVIVFAIVIVVNMIFTKHDWKKDFTKNKLHTLSEQSQKVLNSLTSEIRLKAFVAPNQVQEFTQIFDKYTYQNPKLKTQFIDVDREPMLVKEYKIRQPGTIIVESEARQARVENLTGPDDPKVEEKLTNAIIQVAKGDKKKIYFLIGHGEHLISDTGREGMSEMKDTLEAGRYNVVDLNLMEKDKVPDDAEVVVAAGPHTEITEGEIKSLEAYLQRGGKILMLLEPNSPVALKPWLAKYGADWHPMKAILEANRMQQLAGGNPLTPIVSTYDQSNEITRDAKQLSIYPVATPVEKLNPAPTGMKVDGLLSTSARSLEVQLQGDKVVVNEKSDRKGPISLGLAISGKSSAPAAAPDPTKKDEAKKDTDFRLVIVGDSDFPTNGAKKFGINADLFQNMVSWLSHEEDLISIRPRAADTSEFEITEERARVINLASMVFAPLLMFLSGIMMWAKRRRM